MRSVWLVAIACAGCLHPGAFTCKDGSTCPEGSVCADLTNPDQTLCVQPDQLAACAGKPTYAHCGTDARCYDGVCLPVACGNGRVDRADPSDPTDSGEVCDDGNQTSGDGCSSDCRSDETCGNGVLDPIKGELCDDGNHLQHDGCDSRCQPETPRWVEIPLFGPNGRSGVSLAYDLKRERTVLFGGFDVRTGVYRGDTWESLVGGWTLASPVIAPAPRADYAMAYDAARSRTIVFGGNDAQQYFDDTWLWDGTSWTLVPTLVAPRARVDAAMAYDGHRQRVVMFGGTIRGPALDQPGADTWEWDGTTWTQVSPAHSPPARTGAAIAYDPLRDAIVLFGGNAQTGNVGDTWEYGLDKTTGQYDWRQIAVTTAPAARTGARLFYDPSLGQVRLFGGRNIGDLGDTWTWDGATWTKQLESNLPPPRAYFGAASDPAHNQALIFGGDATIPDPATYTYEEHFWTTVPPVAPQPIGTLHEVGAAYDFAHASVVLLDYESAPATWQFQDGTSWVRLTGGPTPTTMIANDQARGNLVAFDVSTSGNTYTFDGLSWISNAGPTPPLRIDGAMAWDGANQQVLLFGGSTTTGLLGDTWSWDGTSWSMRTPAHQPSAREGAAVGYDPIRHQVVLFGGYDETNQLADTWVWDGSDWSERTPAIAPAARSGATMTWHASRQRLALFGGGSGQSLDQDTWEWNGETWELVEVPNPPPGRASPALFPSPDGTSVFAFGGSLGPRGRIVDLWRLRWEGGLPDESCRENVDADGDGLAGCADPDCWSECTPLCPPGATCAPGGTACGDGVCTKPLESCRLCASDCACRVVCGDTYCDPGEDATSCPGDCP